MRTRPFGFEILVAQSQLSHFDNHIVRKLSALRGQYANEDAFRRMVDGGDPVSYQVYELRRPEVAGELLHGLSVVHPGKVGDEYFMTKGHFHSVRDTGEIYHCLKGRGFLLMENEDGDSAAEELSPGRVVYVPPCWAHRSINTHPSEDLVTLFAYPGNAGHDYGTIEQRGFRKRVIDRCGIPEMIDNPLPASAS